MLTIFADDYHAAGMFESLHELEQFLNCVVVLFKVLKSFGMAVSDTKSQAVLALRGSLSNSIRKRFARKGPDGPFLRIPLLDGALCTPLVSQFRYLGVQLSYCVWPPGHCPQRAPSSCPAYPPLESMCLVHYVIRADVWCHSCRTQNTGDACCSPHPCYILRLPAHLTQTTNSEVAAKAGIRLPSSELAHMLQREAHRCDDPHVALPTGAWWKHVQSSLRTVSESASLSPAPVGTTPHTCPECATLLTHMAKRHPEQYQRRAPEHFCKTRDAVGGLPQCSHCRKKFATWQLLQRHVEGNYCAVRHSFLPQPAEDPVQQQPHLERPPLFMEDPIQTCIGEYSGNAIYHMPNKHRYRYHCIVCGQWIASPKVMKLHYQQSHQGLLSQYGQKATALCQTYTAGGSTCQYCGARLAQPRAHKLVCPVLWQFKWSWIWRRTLCWAIWPRTVLKLLQRPLQA